MIDDTIRAPVKNWPHSQVALEFAIRLFDLEQVLVVALRLDR